MQNSIPDINDLIVNKEKRVSESNRTPRKNKNGEIVLPGPKTMGKNNNY
jgi:hypothetical protein